MFEENGRKRNKEENKSQQIAPHQTANEQENSSVANPLQTEANSPDSTRNATGPRTLQGKQHSRQNGLTKGIFAKTVLSAEPFHERKKDYQNLLAGLQKFFCPIDNFEQILIENLGFQFLRLARIYKADAELVPFIFQKLREGLDWKLGDVVTTITFGNQANVPDSLPTPDLLFRYDTQTWRLIGRILDELERWKRVRNA